MAEVCVRDDHGAGMCVPNGQCVPKWTFNSVCQMDLYTVGLVTGFYGDIRSNVQ